MPDEQLTIHSDNVDFPIIFQDRREIHVSVDIPLLWP